MQGEERSFPCCTVLWKAVYVNLSPLLGALRKIAPAATTTAHICTTPATAVMLWGKRAAHPATMLLPSQLFCLQKAQKLMKMRLLRDCKTGKTKAKVAFCSAAAGIPSQQKLPRENLSMFLFIQAIYTYFFYVHYRFLSGNTNWSTNHCDMGPCTARADEVAGSHYLHYCLTRVELKEEKRPNATICVSMLMLL